MKTELKVIPALIASLFAASPALADDGFKWTGEVGAGLRVINNDGTTRNGAQTTTVPTVRGANPSFAPFTGPEDKAKFNEFRDLKDSAPIGLVDLQGKGSQNYVNLYGENFFLRDQYLNVEGGRYGMFKYRLYNDDMVHNYSWGLLSPLSGSGTSVQTGPAGWSLTNPASAANNPANWNSFDASLKRKTYGGAFEFTNNSPWYIRADAQEIHTDGIRPTSYPLTNSSGAGWMDVGAPVNYKTRNLSLEGGYSVAQGHISANLLRSTFSNDTDTLSFQDPRFGNGMMNVNLPPDNTLTKLGVNGVLRKLPLGSTLSGRYTWSKLENTVGVGATTLSGTDVTSFTSTAVGAQAFSTATPSPSTFNGRKNTTSASLALTSNPLKALDTKLFANWYSKSNSSTQISFPATTGFGATPYTAPDLFNYRSLNGGLDLAYRLNPGNKLGGGYELKNVSRPSTLAAPFEGAKTKDRKWYVEYKNSQFDRVSGGIKYERLNRSTDTYAPQAIAATGVTNPGYMQPFDNANFSQDRIKFTLDATPLPLLDAGIQAIIKKTDYNNSFGPTADKRKEYDASISYGDAKVFRITGFADWEEITFEDTTFEGTFLAPTSAGNFLVGTRQKQTNKMLGLGADWVPMERLTLNASLIWSKTGGGVDFSTNAPATTGATNFTFFNGGLPGYITDNTTKTSLNLKARYDVNKKVAFTGGFAWEKYDYKDDQMNGYFGYYPYYMQVAPVGTSQTPLNSVGTGVWQNPSYKAQVLWGMVSYKFE